jgi:hypothetical protein
VLPRGFMLKLIHSHQRQRRRASTGPQWPKR